MSGNGLDLAKKIGVASDLGGVVRSMKALAASSLGQYERAAESLEDYVLSVELGLGACLRHNSIGRPRETQIRTRHRTILIAFGSDQGLVGSFNESLAVMVDTVLAELGDAEVAVWAVGERMVTLLQARPGLEVNAVTSASSIDAVAIVVNQLLTEIAAARDGRLDLSVQIAHQHLEHGVSYQPVLTNLLPFDARWHDTACAVAWPHHRLPEMIDGPDAVLAELVDAYLFVMLYRACVESLASENSSRLAAMQRAEKNIEALLDEMSRSFHRIRQEAIDEELFDVIAGFEAAQGAGRSSAAPSIEHPAP